MSPTFPSYMLSLLLITNKVINQEWSLWHKGIHFHLVFFPPLCILCLFIYFPFSLYLVLTYTHRYKHTLQICNRIVDPCLFLHSKNSPGYWSTYVLAWCLGQQMGTILPGEGNIRGLLWENMKWNKELRIAEAHKIAQTHKTHVDRSLLQFCFFK